MSTVETFRTFRTFLSGRGLTMSAFVCDGLAIVGFTAIMAFGDRETTLLEGFVLVALLLGFVSALGSMLVAAPAPQPVEITLPDRRRFERRVIDIDNPTGMDRRSGDDRRVCDLSLDSILSPIPGRPGHTTTH
jgi:hypothetical protein